MLLTSRYAVAAMGWVSTVILIRTLPPDAWGGYAFVFSLLGIIGMVSDLRIGRIVLHALMPGDAAADRAATSYLALRALIGIVSYTIAIVAVMAGDYPDAVVRATLLAGTVLVIASCGSALEVIFQARLWIRDLPIGLVLGQAVYLALVTVLAVSGHGTLVLFAGCTLVVAIVDVAWKLRIVRRMLRLPIDTSLWWPWLKEAAPLAIGSVMGTIYFRIDSVMLSQLDTLSAVGAYNIGYKFSDLMASLPGAVLTPGLTLLVGAWPHDLRRFGAIFRQSLVLVLVAGAAMAVGFSVFAVSAITLFYGERYAPVAGAARGLVVGQVVNFFTVLCFSTLVAAGRNRLYPIATLSGVVINVALNLVLIPKWSYNGAAVATVVTELIVVLVLVAGTARLPGLRPLPHRAIAVVLVAAAVMAAVGLGLDALGPWLVAAPLSLATYLAILHVANVDGPGGLRALARRDREPDDGAVLVPADQPPTETS